MSFLGLVDGGDTGDAGDVDAASPGVVLIGCEAGLLLCVGMLVVVVVSIAGDFGSCCCWITWGFEGLSDMLLLLLV